MSDSKTYDPSEELMKKQIMEWDEFSLFVRTHVYLQHYVNLAIEKQFNKNRDLHKRADFTTSLKIQVLHGSKFLSNMMYHNCKIINQIRNTYAHTLNPKDQSISDMIKKMKPFGLAEESIIRMSDLDIYRTCSWATIREIRNALEQNRTAMFYPDETEYDTKSKTYL